MSYTVFVQKFADGQAGSVPYNSVVSVLRRYGSVSDIGQSVEFIPDGDDLCEIGFVGGNRADGVDGVSFERPVSGGRLRELVFELLDIPGMCYFEVDCRFVLARRDVAVDLPLGLIRQCESGSVTIISSATEVPQ
ncbi:hypothetical protein N5B55_21420 [Ralstonia pickettii]|uniref:hypothetical protein n=1 Tax=Ralstonia pickettii TaxID=329 RepID=UPI002714767B|nr:hypothetical protein [Ralstonia pickettii]WKZ87317.1 hypothetical protein N5B55_21420 [Ralstonia pickettii]